VLTRICEVDETRQESGRTLNRPTPEGRALGKELARLCDAAETEQRKRFPNHAERCKSCAFRLGTIPNGCPETLMDAVKCVIEGRDFLCHMTLGADGEPDGTPCRGWMLMLTNAPRGTAPWPFSHEPDAAERLREIVESGRLA